MLPSADIQHRVFMSQVEYLKLDQKQSRAIWRSFRRHDASQLLMNFRILLAPLLQK